MSFSDILSEFGKKFSERVRFDEPLAPYVAYRVGGPADILVFPTSEEELVWIRDHALRWSLPITVIGTGTNLLVHDEGIRGITLSLLYAFREISLIEVLPAGALVQVGGGIHKAELLEWAITQGFSGLEFSSGVPGTVGGGIFMNAGTKYGCYGDILTELRVFDFKCGALQISRQDVHFGYRKQNAVQDSLVLWARFQVGRGDPKAIRETVDQIILERAAKQPLDFPSCGSTFKNPEGLSAGRLIEQANLKGLRVGGAEVSPKHANFILNKGNATASDILTLIDLVKEGVRTRFSVQLECEVIVVGGTIT